LTLAHCRWALYEVDLGLGRAQRADFGVSTGMIRGNSGCVGVHWRERLGRKRCQRSGHDWATRMSEQPVAGDYRICARCGVAEADDKRPPREERRQS
jgi:hypothetical protein